MAEKNKALLIEVIGQDAVIEGIDFDFEASTYLNVFGGTTLTVTEAARDWLTLTGYDPLYGARPLRRVVQSAIGDQLARALLGGEVRDGDEVVVDRADDGDALVVTRREVAKTL